MNLQLDFVVRLGLSELSNARRLPYVYNVYIRTRISPDMGCLREHGFFTSHCLVFFMPIKMMTSGCFLTLDPSF